MNTAEITYTILGSSVFGGVVVAIVSKVFGIRKEEAEIVYVSPDIEQFNVAQYIYEYIVLSMPIIKVYDCEEDNPLPCDEEMLDRLEAKEEENATPNPIWDELRKLTDNDN